MKKTLHALLLLSAGLLPAQTPVLVVPTGHSSYVMSFLASADGKYFLTLGGDDLIKLWNAEGKELRTIRTSEARYNELQLSPDNQHILASYTFQDQEAWVLDIASEAEIYTLAGHTAPLWCATYSPDGKMIATASDDSTAILWDARNGALLHRLRGHLQAVVSTVFSPGGKLLATLSLDKTVRIWETATGKLLRVLETNGQMPSKGAFSPDGKTLSVVTGGRETSISLWSVESGEKIRDLNGYLLRFSPDGQWVCVFQDNAAHLYRSSQLDGKPVRTLRATPVPADGSTVISALSGYFMPDSKSLLINADYGTPEVYDVETGRLKLRLKGYALPVQCASFSPDGKKIVVGSNSDLLEWDLTQGHRSKHIQGTYGKIKQAQFRPDGQKIITVTEEYTGAIWDANSGNEIKPLASTYTLFPRPSNVLPDAGVLAVSPDGQYFVRGHPYGTEYRPPFLSTWSVADGSRVDSIYASPETRAQDAAFSTDGKLVAMAASGSLLVWDLAARKWEKLTETIDYDEYTSVAFLDEKRLAAGTLRGKLEFWDTREKKMIAQDSVADWYVQDLTCSPDRRWIAASVGNRSIGLWRCEPNKTPQFVDFLEGHDNVVSSVEFSPDSRLLLSASQDHTV
ncbi:MAG: WD40 repeat domain-containing protein, partial [Saprospiraceae bacterium]